MFERDFSQVRSIARYLKSAGTEACARPEKIASGTYNEVFKIQVPVGPRGTDVIARLSFYSAASIRKMNRAIEEYKRNGSVPESKLKLACKRVRDHDPVQIKLSMSWISNFFITHDISPHFVYMYHDYDCKNFQQKTGQVVSEDKCQYNNVSFHERFDTEVPDLSKLLIGDTPVSEDQLICILFQVIYTLATIQHYIPGFRHNDLSCQNILIKRLAPPADKRMFYRYDLYGRTFYVPVSEATTFAAIYDFDLTHASAHIMELDRKHPEINLRNDVIESNRFAGNKQPDVRATFNAAYNPSFDMHFFLYTLAYFLQRSNKVTCNSATREFPRCRLYPNVQNWLVSLGVMPSLTANMAYKSPRYVGHIITHMIPVNLLFSPIFQRYTKPTAPDDRFVIKSFRIKQIPIQVVHESTMLKWKKPEVVWVDPEQPPMLFSAKPNVNGGTKHPIFHFDPVKSYYQPLNLLSVFQRENFYPNLIPAIFIYGAPQSITRLDAALIHKACADLNANLLQLIARKLMISASNLSPADLCKIISEIVAKRHPKATDNSDLLTYKHKCSLFFEKNELVAFAKEQGLTDDKIYTTQPTGQRVLKRKQDLCDALISYFLER